MSLSKLILLEFIGCVLFGNMAVNAEIPQTPVFKNYSHLLKRSPFKIKVNQMVEQVKQPTVRMDYFLRGVTKLEGGWMVVLVDRKKPKENIIIKQGVKNSSGIELLEVLQNKEDYKLTLAKLKINTQEVTVGYNKAELQQVLQHKPKPNIAASKNTVQKPPKAIPAKQNPTPKPPQKKKGPTPSF